MGYIPTPAIESLKQMVPIATVIGQHVELREDGKDVFVGESPFPAKNKGKIRVHNERAKFRCESTGIRGDAIDYLRRARRMGFVQAVEELARIGKQDLQYLIDKYSEQESLPFDDENE
ncbi:CHC2 zinc finger domain-containing protein [Pelagicoccus mobilis]|uniref:Zinc finger CHC2-type domain-containing protein n=1 Tax=Pelagicoccus mobilis TaxID=415221 RepID=A0A934RTH0_9BACT|nr:CHC2 zinc finger domain-containing protein [Pelagicoccus mobilis]MBK1876086.1 hypothetical protein [Pelagicoccus mobilis]